MTDAARVIRTRYGCVEFWPWGARTLIDGLDGSVPATPHTQMPDYREITRRCGYGEDCLVYCQHHELARMVVAEWLFDRPSDVLAAIAEGQMLSGAKAAYEELAAQTLQRWAIAGERPIIGGVDWFGMRDRFLGLVDAA